MPISQNGWSLRKTSNSNTTLGWLERLLVAPACDPPPEAVVPWTPADHALDGGALFPLRLWAAHAVPALLIEELCMLIPYWGGIKALSVRQPRRSVVVQSSLPRRISRVEG